MAEFLDNKGFTYNATSYYADMPKIKYPVIRSGASSTEPVYGYEAKRMTKSRTKAPVVDKFKPISGLLNDLDFTNEDALDFWIGGDERPSRGI